MFLSCNIFNSLIYNVTYNLSIAADTWRGRQTRGSWSRRRRCRSAGCCSPPPGRYAGWRGGRAAPWWSWRRAAAASPRQPPYWEAHRGTTPADPHGPSLCATEEEEFKDKPKYKKAELWITNDLSRNSGFRSGSYPHLETILKKTPYLLFSISIYSPTTGLKLKINFNLSALSFLLDPDQEQIIPDPDPGKNSGSHRIRIHNTEKSYRNCRYRYLLVPPYCHIIL